MPFFDNSSKHQVDRQHTVWCNPHENNFWIAKSESLELVCPAAPTPDLSIIPCVLSGLGKFCVVLIMCLQPLPQPPRWQSMPRSDTKWHRITVLCRCFRETLCCQLGLGDWLASQSPHQVDSTHGANKNCQPTTKSIIVWQCSRARPTRICKLSGLSMVLCTSCQTPCPTRQ